MAPNEPEDDIVNELERIVEYAWRVPVSQVVVACLRAANEIENYRSQEQGNQARKETNEQPN